MFYFVPSWYHENRYRELEQAWYVRRSVSEFDDSVKQIQLFNRNKFMDYSIILLSFAPNFRHFLHRQGVFHAPYWSCFDAIQNVCRKEVDVLSYRNLNWPEHIEFVHTPFCVVANLKDTKYAEIHFGEDGNMIEVLLFKRDQVCRKNIYDDRGFLSSSVVYREGKPVYEQYLTPKGRWKICEFYYDGHIEVNPEESSFLMGDQLIPFSKQSYTNMEELLQEVTKVYVDQTKPEDIFCLAMHELHHDLIESLFGNKRNILSFFQHRMELFEDVELKQLMNQASYIVSDSKNRIPQIRAYLNQDVPIIDITPFDTRVDFGISQQLNVQNILVPVDHMQEEVFDQLIVVLAQYLETNHNARIHFFTRNAHWNRENDLLGRTKEVLEAHGYNPLLARKENENVTENAIDTSELPKIKFFVDQCVDELSVSKTVRLQRVLLDVTDRLDLYLIISCISTAIPQILKHPTQYVKDHKNGLYVEKLEEIPQALAYYLDGLNNWNKAMIASYEIGKEYNTSSLIQKWKEVLRSIEQDYYTSNRSE